MSIWQITLLVIITTIFLAIQIIAAIVSYKMINQKIYPLEQILEEDTKGVSNLFNLREYIKHNLYKKEQTHSGKHNIFYEIWGSPKYKNFIILIHGVSNRKERMLKYAKVWNDLGYNAILFDGRGFNEHKHLGNLTFGFKEADLLNVIKNDLENKYEVNTIGFHGESMGAATIFNWVKKYKNDKNIDFIVAESGYFSFIKPIVQGMKNKRLPRFLIYILLFFVIRWSILLAGVNVLNLKISKRNLKKFNLPIMLISTKEDKIVPFKEHIKIKKQLDAKNIQYYSKEFVGSRHTRILIDEQNQKEWIDNIKIFIKEITNEK